MAVLENRPPPEVQASAKAEDEGVYEYFKTKGVFGLLKVSRMVSCCVTDVQSLQRLLAQLETLTSLRHARAACADLRGQAPPRRRAALPCDISGYSGEGAVLRQCFYCAKGEVMQLVGVCTLRHKVHPASRTYAERKDVIQVMDHHNSCHMLSAETLLQCNVRLHLVYRDVIHPC